MTYDHFIDILHMMAAEDRISVRNKRKSDYRGHQLQEAIDIFLKRPVTEYERMKLSVIWHKWIIKRIHKIERDEAMIAKYRDGKYLYFEESGMDCDCTQYAGKVHKCKANRRAIDRLYAHIGEWADGPFYLSIITKEEADNMRYRSRDRAAEAFEDGHPHSVSWGAL